MMLCPKEVIAALQYQQLKCKWFSRQSIQPRLFCLMCGLRWQKKPPYYFRPGERIRVSLFGLRWCLVSRSQNNATILSNEFCWFVADWVLPSQVMTSRIATVSPSDSRMHDIMKQSLQQEHTEVTSWPHLLRFQWTSCLKIKWPHAELMLYDVISWAFWDMIKHQQQPLIVTPCLKGLWKARTSSCCFDWWSQRMSLLSGRSNSFKNSFI